MEIGVLGPLVLRVDGRTVTPSANKHRQVLALLVVRANAVVPVGDLIQELWDGDPPPSAKPTLQGYVLRLRRLLGTPVRPGAAPLHTWHGGYQLRVEREALDAHRFEDLATRGVQARLAGDLDRASDLMREALAVWRGPAFVDVVPGRMLAIHTSRYAEARLAVLERLAESELLRGRHQEIVGDLTELAAQHPYHERIHAHLMLALYRCLRRSHALDVFRRLRHNLASNLGIEPSLTIQRLHRAILNGDPHLEQPAAGGLLERLAA